MGVLIQNGMEVDKYPTQTTDTDNSKLDEKTGQILDTRGHEHQPLLPQSDRIVVYGSRGSGAADLATHIQTALIEHGVPEDEARIDWTRHVTSIEPTFFANHSQQLPERIDPPQHPALEAPQTASRGLFQRLRQLLPQKPPAVDQDPLHEVAVPEISQPETDPFQHTRPRGVLIFPEMRQYSGATAMTVPTNAERIVRLCEENNVPYVYVEKVNADDSDIEQAVAALLSQDPTRAIEVR